MPQKNSAQLSKRQKTSAANQKRAVSLAVEDDDAFFGRVVKINMARCVLNIWDHQKKRHIEVQATLPNKKKGIIRINDLVNVAKSHPNWEVQVAVDAKTIQELKKMKRISPELAVEPSGSMGAAASAVIADGFEFDYDGLEEKEDEDALAAQEAAMKEKKGSAVVEDDDVDVDAI
jgi:hypothetical protein